MKTYDELKALIEQRGVHTVFGPYGEGWFIEQNADELAQFLVEMQKLGVTSVLEIGSGWKAGLSRFMHDDLHWQVVSVDVQDYGHAFDGIEYVTDKEHGDLGNFDLVIIDADHSYEGVKADHEFYGGAAELVIAFHDICGLRDCEGVKQYWDEIAYDGKALKPGYHEIIADTDERSGIGYIVLAEVAAPTPTPPKPKAAPRKRTPAKKPAAKTTVKAQAKK